MSGWSQEYLRCRQCGTVKVPHKAHGYCNSCYTAIIHRGHDPATYQPNRDTPRQTREEKNAAATERQKLKPPPPARKADQNRRNYLRRLARAATEAGNLEESKRLNEEADKIN